MPCLVNPNVPLLLCFTLYLRVISKYKPPGANIRRGDLTEGFSLRYEFGGLILGGAYFRNFTVYVYQSTVEAVVVHVAWQCKIDMQCNRTITRNAQFKISNDDPILSIL